LSILLFVTFSWGFPSPRPLFILLIEGWKVASSDADYQWSSVWGTISDCWCGK